MSYLSLLLFVLAIAGFGSAFALSNIAVDHFSPMHVATARAIIAAAATLIFIVIARVRVPITSRHLIIYFVLGVLTVAAPFALIAWSQSLIDSSLGGVVFASMPLITLLMSAVILPNSVPTKRQLLGAVIGMTGVFIASTGGSFSPDGATLSGAALTLLAVVCYSVGGVYVKRFDNIDPRAMTCGQLLGAMLVLMLIGTWDLPSASLPTAYIPYAVLLWLGVFSTAMPMIAIFLLIQREGPASASLTAFFMPVTAMSIGTVFLNEAIPNTLIIGCILVILGAWFVVQQPASQEKAA